MTLNKKKVILFLGDAIILFFSLYLTLIIRYGANFTPAIWQIHRLPFTVLYIFWLIIFYINNLYSLTVAKVSFDFYQKLAFTLLICGVFSVAFFYLIPQISIAPKTTLFLNLIIIAILFSIWRNLFNIIIKSTTKNNIIILGYSEIAYNLAKKLNNNPQLGYKILAFAGCEQKNLENIKVITSESDLQNFIKHNNISAIIINSDADGMFMDAFLNFLPLGINFISFTDFYENLFAKIPISEIKQNWFLENLTEGSKGTYDTLKRILDIITAIVIGIISLPLFPFISIAIKINSKGPIFFKQLRTGKNGRNFLAIKFRSMIDNAENEGAKWSPENDPRITSVGKFIRKTRLDEIPQIINVLRGEMSLVGPRPERPEFIEILEKEIPFYCQRLLVNPGLTGWAQVNFPYGASKKGSMQKLQYDLYYIKHRSLSLDIKILLKTFAIVFGFKGR